MDESVVAQARERVTRWLEEGREVLGVLPELLQSERRFAVRAEQAEREVERLRKDGADLRKEAIALREQLVQARQGHDGFEKEREDLRAAIDHLRRENAQLKAEKDEAAGAFAKLLETVQSTNQIAQKLGVTKSPFARQPASVSPAPSAAPTD